MRLSSDPDNLLSIYLDDHLAGATAGVELARRLVDSNREDEDFGVPLTGLCAEIEADRATLDRLMKRLGASRNPAKPLVAWAGEKLGRLKLNGQLRGYSPLSRLVELEALGIGITGKMRMWTALQHTLGERVADFDFEELAQRAARQRGLVDELHLEAATRALPHEGEDR